MDAVVKVGGSLAEHPHKLKALCLKLATVAQKHRIVVVPGGGRFADAVRDLDQKLNLPASAAHQLAISAMDQYGLVLAQFTPNCKTTDTLENAKTVSESKLTPILLPSKLLLLPNPLEASWDVTSDSIAAYIAIKLNAAKTVFVTDVDGIFTADPKTHKDAQLISELSVDRLSQFSGRTSVDAYLPRLLSRNSLDCYVVNGAFPERLAAVLAGRKVVGTHILPV